MTFADSIEDEIGRFRDLRKAGDASQPPEGR